MVEYSFTSTETRRLVRMDRPGRTEGRKETWCLKSTETIRLIRDGEPGTATIVQELCESRGGRPVLSVLTSLLVSADVKNY